MTALRGVGCFETVRIHRGAPFRLGAHLARLERGLSALRLAAPRGRLRADTAMHAVVERNHLEEALVRYTVAPAEAGASEVRAVAVPRALPTIPSRVRLVVARSGTRKPGTLSAVKTTLRDSEDRAAEEARRRDAFDAILLNVGGRAVETTARNLFAVRDRDLVTPSLVEGALPGVTRDVVLESAAGLGIPISGDRLSVEDLLTADESFLTGSGVGVLPVHELEDRVYGPVPGPITERLQVAYAARLDEESRWPTDR